MDKLYRIRFKTPDLEIEVESSEKNYVNSKFKELLEMRVKSSVADEDTSPVKKKPKDTKKKKTKPESESVVDHTAYREIDVMEFIEKLKDHKDYQKIEENIINKRAVLPRILMCLYYALEFLGEPTLRTGHIEKITDQLTIKIKRSNVGTAIKKNSKYFSHDTARKKGAIINYKLNRQGIQAFDKLLAGETL